MHDPESEYLDHAGFDVYLDETALHAVGSQVGETLRDVVACGGQLRAAIRRQLVLPKVGNVRQLRKRQCPRSRSAAKSALCDVDLLGRGFQDASTESENLAAQVLGRQQRRLTADGYASGCPRAAAYRR